MIPLGDPVEVIVEIAFDQPEPVGDIAHAERGKLAVAHEREAGIEAVNAASVARGCAQWRKFDRLVEPY